MEIKEWLQVWQFEHNPFVIFDADRDPYLQTAMVENTSLRSVLLHLEKPSPYVIFAIRGAGKSSMRIDTERYLRQYEDKVLVISYVEFNELLSEVSRPRRLPIEYSANKSALARIFKRKKEEPLAREAKMTLDDHLDYILKLGIEELYGHILEAHKEDMLKDNREIAEKFLLLTALYFAPNDLSSKVSALRRQMEIAGYKKKSNFFAKSQAKFLAGEIYRYIRGVPVSLEGTFKIIQEIGPGLFEFHGIPRTTENRFTLLKSFMELVRYFGLSGVYLLVDRVDEPTSIKGDPEKMRELVTPVLDDQLFQIDHLGIIMFLPYELHDLKKYYRSDRIKTISSINWSAENMIRLIEKRMNVGRKPGSPPLQLADIFEEDGESKAQFIVRQLTPRNAFRLLSIIVEEHCGTVIYGVKISTEVYESAVQRYLIEKEGY
ncbi:hypothetical protein [Methylomagnum ishizawai]|uniref:hypothetical protein n=1 Tax=Methylomagnum ishizawai TaxID=1760988 RepID=UPI001C3233C1|nr:hypothetical protein [Methylomagnum ishizawai]BBL74795.1 hypothetical protein MishRS11D_18930 [Methylomagnum ishizawai]